MVETRSWSPGQRGRRDHDLLAARPDHRPSGEPAQPDFGALEVSEHADDTAPFCGDLADRAVLGQVIGSGAMAEVQPGHVHSGVNEFRQLRCGSGSRSERANDLGAAIHGSPSRRRCTALVPCQEKWRCCGKDACRAPARETLSPSTPGPQAAEGRDTPAVQIKRFWTCW